MNIELQPDLTATAAVFLFDSKIDGVVYTNMNQTYVKINGFSLGEVTIEDNVIEFT